MNAFASWCEQAVSQVRFHPDHAAIEAELTAHYEDHCLDLERIGYPPELAAERALGAMGDAEEIGKALDKAHKPWLGWLWMVSRGLLAVALVLLLFLSVFSNPAGKMRRIANSLFPPEDVGFYEEDLEGLLEINRQYGEEVWTLGGPLSGEPVRAGGYTFSLVKGSWWDWSVGYCRAWCILRVEPDRFWYGEPENIYDDLRLTASDGRELVNVSSRNSERARQLGNERVEWFTVNSASFGKPVWEGDSRSTRVYAAEDLGGWYLAMMLTTQKPMDWMDLSYSCGENDWSLRIDWGEET